MPTHPRNDPAAHNRYITTVSGRKVWPEWLEVDDICLNDIVQALANEARWGGHTYTHYSVAQHSCMVFDHAYEAARNMEEVLDLRIDMTFPWTIALAAGLHDAHEAYLKDIPTPIKLSLGKVFTDMADRADLAIAEKFGIHVLLLTHPMVTKADAAVLEVERRDLKRRPEDHIRSDALAPTISPWSPEVARHQLHERISRALTALGKPIPE